MDPLIVDIMESEPSAKKRAKALAHLLVEGSLTASAVADTMRASDPVTLAALVEGIEAATRKNPDLVDSGLFLLLVHALRHDASSVRRESARTIANVAATHVDDFGPALRP